jgi:diguanylate cyclase (GGDEF)-like protein
MAEAPSLHIQQLVELLAVVSSFTDEKSAVQGAVERSAQALEAEVAAVVFGAREESSAGRVEIFGDRVAASIGFPAGSVPERDLIEVAHRERTVLAVPGLGSCPVTVASWSGDHPGYLILARWGDDGFTIEEQNLVRGMARLLQLTLTMLRAFQAEHELRQQSERQAEENRELLISLRERQRLLEHLFTIQRAISRRQQLDQILDTVTAAAHDLLGADIVELWLMEEDDPEMARLRSVVGLDAGVVRRLPAVPVGDAGTAGMAMELDQFVVMTGEGEKSPVLGRFGPGPVFASLAVPVHLNNVVSGALLVSSCRPGREFTHGDEQTLQAFAGHVNLALSDHRTMQRMHLAFHDALTGLPSRGLFLEHLSAQLDATQAPVALLFLDLDRFKDINDTLGHSTGDQFLMLAAERIREALRPGDEAARWGGDEFAVRLAGATSAEQAMAVAQRVIEVLRAPAEVGAHRLRVDVSIGVALSTPGQGGGDLIRCADVAMYGAKRNGRGRAELFTGASVAGLPVTGGNGRGAGRRAGGAGPPPPCTVDTQTGYTSRS